MKKVAQRQGEDAAGGELLHGGRHNMLRPCMSNALPFQTAKQLAAAIRKKKIGCLELLDLYLKRIEAHNPSSTPSSPWTSRARASGPRRPTRR